LIDLLTDGCTIATANIVAVHFEFQNSSLCCFTGRGGGDSDKNPLQIKFKLADCAKIEN